MRMNPHRSGDQRRHAEEARKVEDVRSDDDTDPGVFVAGHDRRHG